MEHLDDITLKQVSDYIINKTAKKRNISKSLARKLFVNALRYTLVINTIEEQIDFLMDADNEEEMPCE